MVQLINMRQSDLKIDHTKSKFVCSLHFSQTQFNSQHFKCNLRKDAIPTLINCPKPPKNVDI